MNQILSLYFDELYPERRLERNQAVVASTDKMNKLIKFKKPPKTKTTPPTQPQKKSKSITLGKPKNG